MGKNPQYAREAYKNGLMLEAQLGANPFKFGLAGGTDAHTGLTAAAENNFFGKFPTSEPSPERWNENAFEFEGRVNSPDLTNRVIILLCMTAKHTAGAEAHLLTNGVSL